MISSNRHERSDTTSSLRPHPLHIAVANTIQRFLDKSTELIRDPACGGAQHLPLFVGKHRARHTRMCCVDLLIISSGQVRAIVEIEESGFPPTKICGKFFQAALADHFIHDMQSEVALPYGPEALFVQVLDGSKCLRPGTRKDVQAQLIEKLIHSMLPMRSLKDYRLFFVSGPDDHSGLDKLGKSVSSMLA